MIKISRGREKSAGHFAGQRIGTAGVALGFLFLAISSGWSQQRQILHGQVPGVVPQLQALHRLEATNVLQLAIGLPLRNQAELTNLLQDIYNPASPNYRHFLTADEFANRFGPSEQDYQAVIEFAKTNGFRVVGTHPNRMLVDVAAAVPDIEKTFHLNMRVYRHPTEARDFYAPDAEPQLDLATPVLHISGLDNFFVPEPLCREMPATGATASPATAQPAVNGSGPSGNYAGKDFRAAYAPGVTNTGAGQLVGLLEFQGYYASDILKYETNFSLPNIPLTNVLLGGLSSITADAGDAECPLDIEMAISMATNLSGVIVYCTTRSGNTDTILNQMATDNSCKQLSASWIIGADATALQIYQQMAAQGQSFFNASGDSDAASAAVPLGEDAPYITTVGGTTLVTTGAGGSRVSENTWNRGNGTGSTGGISTTYAIPLWQQGINMNTNQGSAFMRNVPDVACVAENVWVLYNNGGSGAFGGTSCAAPLWAGFMALVNQQAVAAGQPFVGFINPSIYAIGKSSSYGSDFHDITTGNNTLPSSPNRFYAFPGYDLCTGWGTPSGQNLINNLVLGTGDTLMVTPASGLNMAGPMGGPFVPTSGIFSLANFAGTTNKWSLINTSAWFSASPGSGTLLSSAKANVTVTVAVAANSLPAGFYSAILLFSNQTTSVVQNFPLTLVVGTKMTWDSSASGGVPQDGPGVWADQSSIAGNTNWWTGADDVLWTNDNPVIATFGANSGAADVVTLGSDVAAAGINFNPPGSGNYTIADGGNTLTLDGNVITSNSATISAPVTLGMPATFSAASGQMLTVSGVIAGGVSNNLAITGPGTVNLTGQNNTSSSAGMAGIVTVNSGTLSLNSSSIFGTLGNVSGITVASGATLSLQGTNAISGSSGLARNITLNGGSMTNAGDGNHAIGILTLNGGTVSGTGSPTAGSFNLTGDVFVYTNATISAQNLTTTSAMAFKVGGGQTLTLSGTLIGTGPLTCNGSGTVIVTTNNTYSGGTTVNYGTLRLLNTNGLGSPIASVTVGSGGQLQIYANMTSSRPLTLNGYGPVADGALRISSGANVIWTGVLTLGSPSTIALDSGTTLAINNSIGGSYGLTLDAGSGSQGVAAGAINIASGSISKSGAGTWILSGNNTFTGGLNVDTSSTTASDGILRLASPGAVPTGTSPVQILNNNSGSSTLQLDGSTGSLTLTTPFNVNCRNNAVATIENLSGTNTIGGPVWLNVGGSLFNIQSDAGQLIFKGTNQYTGTLTGGRTYAFSGAGDFLVSGPILNSTNGAPISLTKSGTGTLTLGGTNTYGNGTTLSGGTLLVNGSITGAVSVASSTTLGGKGIIFSTVIIPSGAMLAPGTNSTSIGTLTASNSMTLQSGSTTRMKISKTPLTNDVLRVAGVSGAVTYAGTLTVTNLAGTLAAGDSFKLFSAANYTGAFAAINLPPLVSGLAWSNTLASDGMLQIVATTPPSISSVALSGGNFVLSVGGGPRGSPFRVLATTNIALPLTDWTPLWTNFFDSNGNGSFTNTIDPSAPQQFYDIAVP
jgi:autotransporter-associated beta strand protein